VKRVTAGSSHTLAALLAEFAQSLMFSYESSFCLTAI
jgi:hypothetical protein